MHYKIATLTAFDRDLKNLKRKHRDMGLLEEPVALLKHGEMDEMARRYRDHALTGNWAGFREFHIQADWLVVYFLSQDEVTFVLARSSNHDSLYRNVGRKTIRSYKKQV